MRTLQENYRPISLMNTDAKIQQNTSKPNSAAHLKGSYTMIKWDSNLRYEGGSTYTNEYVIHHINRMKDKNHMIT